MRLSAIIDSAVQAVCRVGGNLERRLARLTRAGTYRLEDGTIVKHNGLFTSENLRVADIMR
jgi:hypothetical protein